MKIKDGKNNYMTTTIIISVYKNVKALKLVLDSILNQTINVNEIIVSEDGQSPEMKEFIDSLTIPHLIHLNQEDLKWRKNIALNKSIKKASGDYLIFIDGDVVLHKRFVEGHIYCSKPKRVCSGKRVELGPNYTQKLLAHELTIDELSDSFIRRIISLHKDNVRHYEDGIYINPKGFLYNKIIQKKHINYLIGCNFSCYKEDMESINGFNEDFKLPSVGEDVDINWRFRASGIEVISCRNIANVYHLYHKKGFNNVDLGINDKILKEAFDKNRYICLNGLNKLKEGESL
ncbi:glycosyltransferase [Candidatus Sulfurimonas baltica]|uniref:Glycosyltransferase n=1 Tax=Candidatus Sulfurimonas baltica TaxID=2740404 RepID=A0A7S7LU30_9BACT|nr:glycosyltransferase [Candidatus Sulfurimonas baltica]QOY51413.1 glycosyltransferase [Candidatus Sulfurimonas baltica]